jgi:TatD DNase family protein
MELRRLSVRHPFPAPILMIIDTHCHFNNARFAEDLSECLQRAQEAGVTQMIVVGYDLPSSEQAVALAEAYPGTLSAVVGVHPHDAKTWNTKCRSRLRALAERECVVALGEIGLDFHYDFSPRPAQYEAFRAQMALAHELALPVVIHCREAYPETLDVLEQENVTALGGVMHCWAGTLEEAERTVALGMHLGFGGVLTFKNAENVRDTARHIPADRLLLETDAPYLAPMPFRGKRCEPVHTALVAARLAELRGLSLAALAELTTANARRLFARLASPAL